MKLTLILSPHWFERTCDSGNKGRSLKIEAVVQPNSETIMNLDHKVKSAIFKLHKQLSLLYISCTSHVQEAWSRTTQAYNRRN